MRHLWILLAAAALTLMFALVTLADSSGRIYGKITTVDDDVFEGLIRWDKNEGSWVDVLNGNKELRRHDRSKRTKYRDRERSIELFGITIARTGGASISWGNVAQSGMRFGHLASLEVIDDDAALFTLKSGETVELDGGSSDIGTGVREIIIEDLDEGEIELVWDDIERIDFMQGDGSLVSNLGERLYGTLTTRRGDEYTGYVCWDIDELFTRDILDGDLKGRRRKIKFGKIQSIERYSSSGATVILNNDDELLLRGTNDVDDDNSGIIISDLGFGQVIVHWDEFDRLDFHEPSEPLTYAQFDGGHELRGTVFTEDGEEYTGTIRWDDDEEYSWELLDGDYRDVEFDIEFGLIKEIAKKSYRSSVITVWDGRTFRLRGSNDVDEDNKGIFITTSDGEEIEVDWEDFERVEFARN